MILRFYVDKRNEQVTAFAGLFLPVPSNNRIWHRPPLPGGEIDTFKSVREAVEWDLVQRVLRKHNGKIAAAAEPGISGKPSTS